MARGFCCDAFTTTPTGVPSSRVTLMTLLMASLQYRWRVNGSSAMSYGLNRSCDCGLWITTDACKQQVLRFVFFLVVQRKKREEFAV